MKKFIYKTVAFVLPFWLLLTVVDYLVPAWFTKLTGGSKYASRGAIIGLLAGLIFPLPFGMVVSSLLCAFLGVFFVDLGEEAAHEQ